MNTSPETPGRTPIKIAYIGAGAVIIAAIIGIIPLIINFKPVERSISVHVADQNSGSSVQGAKVLLFLEGSPFAEFTDSSGVSTFSVTAPRNSSARLFVETDQYEIYDANVKLTKDQNIEVRLTPKGSNDRKIIVRVVDDSNSTPIDGAEILLIESGNTYSESTDSNGLAKFTVTFVNDRMDADISVSTAQYKIEHKVVTLLPNEIQDIRLNLKTNELAIAPFVAPSANQSGDPGANVIAYGDILSETISAPTEIDRYTFTGSTGDVILIKIAKSTENTGGFETEVRLLDGNGVLLGNTATWSSFISAELQSTLPVDGEYVILIDDGGDGTQTGDYTLNLQKIAGP